MWHRKIFIIVLFFCHYLIGSAQSPELIFHSGFEPDVVTIDHNSDDIDIVGVDLSVSPPNDWVKDLEEHPNMGYFNIQFKGGNIEDRIAEIVKDPTDPTNNVLRFWILNPNSGSRGRIQANLYENNGLHVIYYSVRLFLPGDFNILKNAPFKWHFTIQEFWNNANWTGEDYIFRMRVHLNKMLEEPDSLRIDVGGQIWDEAADDWGDDIWEYYNTDFVVPVQKWMTLRTYIVEGDENTGRFIFTITPDGGSEQIVHNVRNYTHNPNDPNPDGLSHINPIKLYSADEIVDYVRDNGGVLNCYWDDFEFWKDSVFTTNEGCLSGGVTFSTQEEIDNFSSDFPKCNTINGDVTIKSEGDINNLNGLSQITFIKGNLNIEANNILTDLSGLENLESVNGYLHINSNIALINISALNKLNSLNGDLEITNNKMLSDLTGLENLTAISGSLTLSENESLTSLAGLENINYSSITNLIITNSPMLSFCNLYNICNYLVDGNPATISGNAPGCANLNEVSGACLVALPVELVAFNGIERAGDILLSWETASEINNDYFSLEHSLDGRYFSVLEEIKGNGNSNRLNNYQFVHKNPPKGLNYYRLKQVDYDGGITYSDIIVINVINIGRLKVKIHPNPTSGLVEVKSQNNEALLLKISDINGRIIESKKINGFSTINLSGKPKGIYFFIFQSLEGIDVERIVKY